MLKRTPSSLDGITLTLISILCLGTLLLLYNLGAPSLSVDEFVNVQIERHDWVQMLSDLKNGQDLHPPLTHFLMSLWLQSVGENEWTIRLPWVVAGIFTLWLVFRLGRALGSRQLGLAAAFLTLTAPTFVLYTRFDKYYSLTLTLSMALILAGLGLWRHPSRQKALVYGVIVLLLLYTDYFAPLFLVIGQALMLALFGREWKRVRLFLAAQALAGLAYLPWLSILLSQVHALQGMAEADVATSWSGLAVKLGYLFYSFSMGETIFPWRPLAIMGLVVVLAMLASGIWTLRRQKIAETGVPTLFLLGTFFLLPAVGATVLTSYSFTTVPFISFPNHVLFILPFFSLTLAAGLLALPTRLMLPLATSLLVLSRAASLYNYFEGQEYHNPIYVVPMREVASQVADQSQSGDIILSDPDTGFQFYYERGSQPVPSLLTTDSTAIAYLEGHSPPRVWLLTFGRDRTREATPLELMRWLETNYRLTLEQGYAEQDPTYRWVKERLLHRPAYQYKLLMQRYERATP